MADDPSTEVYYGALGHDGSMDWWEDRLVAEEDARKYDLPLYRVTITYERLDLTQEHDLPPQYVYVVTRYGGHRHVALSSNYYPGRRHFTTCRGVSSWTVQSWRDNPDHPLGLTANEMENLPVCPQCQRFLSSEIK